jgi:hypothetical protein
MLVSWEIFKSVCVAKSLSMQWLDLGESYELRLFDGMFGLECTIVKTDTAAVTDFETNFKLNGNSNLSQGDADGAQIVRIKAAKKGWTYAAIPLEFKTAEINSLYSKLVDGTNRPGISLKFYNQSGQEITTEGLLEINESTIIRSVIDFEPSYDYEIIGGELRIDQDITSLQDCRLYIIAVPDVPANMGGSKEMAGGINLRYLAPQNTMVVDGRVSKTLIYDPIYHTNKIRLIFEHTAGLKVWIHVTLELYRP